VQALFLAFVMAQVPLAGFLRLLGVAAATGAMVALTTHGSFVIWYHFPTAFAVADGAMTFVGYVIAGAVIALILRRARTPSRHPATA
jgi:hypothetical protein